MSDPDDKAKAQKRSALRVVRRVLWYVTLAIFLTYMGLGLLAVLRFPESDAAKEAAGFMWAKGIVCIAACWFAFGRNPKEVARDEWPRATRGKLLLALFAFLLAGCAILAVVYYNRFMPKPRSDAQRQATDAAVRALMDSRLVLKLGDGEVQVRGEIWQVLNLDKKRETARLLTDYYDDQNLRSPRVVDFVTGRVYANGAEIVSDNPHLSRYELLNLCVQAVAALVLLLTYLIIRRYTAETRRLADAALEQIPRPAIKLLPLPSTVPTQNGIPSSNPPVAFKNAGTAPAHNIRYEIRPIGSLTPELAANPPEAPILASGEEFVTNFGKFNLTDPCGFIAEYESPGGARYRYRAVITGKTSVEGERYERVNVPSRRGFLARLRKSFGNSRAPA